MITDHRPATQHSIMLQRGHWMRRESRWLQRNKRFNPETYSRRPLIHFVADGLQNADGAQVMELVRRLEPHGEPSFRFPCSGDFLTVVAEGRWKVAN